MASWQGAGPRALWGTCSQGLNTDRRSVLPSTGRDCGYGAARVGVQGGGGGLGPHSAGRFASGGVGPGPRGSCWRGGSGQIPRGLCCPCKNQGSQPCPLRDCTARAPSTLFLSPYCSSSRLASPRRSSLSRALSSSASRSSVCVVRGPPPAAGGERTSSDPTWAAAAPREGLPPSPRHLWGRQGQGPYL